jgi:hypothetical protein
MSNDLIEKGEEILNRIAEDAETNPLKCAIHYRDAANLLPDLITTMKRQRIQILTLTNAKYVNTYKVRDV